MESLGTEEGNVCGRDGCDGILVMTREGECRCHISPPCSSCVNMKPACPKCHWVQEDDDGQI